MKQSTSWGTLSLNHMNKIMTIAILAITLTGCETYRAAQKDFKTFVNDVSLNIGRPMDTHWRAGTSVYQNERVKL
jgi:hypothetical protein